MKISNVLRNRRKWVWEQWSKILRDTHKPISLRERSKIFRKLNKQAKNMFR